MMGATGLKNQSQFADFVGTSQPAVARAVKEGKIPDAWFYKVAHRTGRRIEWLQTGNGPECLSDAVAEVEERYGLARSPALKSLLEQRAELHESQQQIVDRAVQMILDSDMETRALLLQVLERVYEHHKSLRQSRGSAHPKKGAGPA